MKKANKLVLFMMCMALLLSVFGCSANSPAASSTPKPTTKLDAIKAKGYIVWGTNAEFMPFEYKSANGNVVGVDADIAKAVADSLGVQLKVEDMAFDSLPAALASGKIDFIGAGYTKDDERMQNDGLLRGILHRGAGRHHKDRLQDSFQG